MKKHITIPIFIPGYGCSNDCVFCNQKSITGVSKNPSSDEVCEIIKTWLSSINIAETEVEIAFFGGNFLGLSTKIQREYLSIAEKFVKQGKISSIRFSSRPDTITENSLNAISDFSVKTIEIGVQSMDDEVLCLSGRGHTSKDSEKAAKLILKFGYTLGMQMMVGLPGDNPQKSLNTALAIIKAGASQSRIYPVLVIKNTALETLYHQNKYSPLSINDAVKQVAPLVDLFKKNQVKILKVGLHPSEAYAEGKDLIAGPYHPSFHELVLSEIWKQRLEKELIPNSLHEFEIRVNSKEINHAIGYNGSNRNWIKMQFKKVVFTSDNNIPIEQFIIKPI